MSTIAAPTPRPPVVYPDSDGKPMAENTLQYQWITTITGGIERVFGKDPNVFVAGDLFWYPVEGRPDIVAAPDTMVAFGRQKGHRLSYRQWEEGGIPPQVVFEILSPSNRFGEMSEKFDFYQRYGVEEYYIFDPDPLRLELSGFVRRGEQLARIPVMNGYQSPRLGVRFEFDPTSELRIIGPDGQPFRTYLELSQSEEEQRQRAEQERQRAEQERQRAEQAIAEVQRLREQLQRRGPNAI
jgi:Uma2 family endonuclease